MSEPPTTNARNPKIYTPRAGSLANECTDTSTPERTKKVPNRLNEKTIIDSNIVQLLKVERFSVTASE